VAEFPEGFKGMRGVRYYQVILFLSALIVIGVVQLIRFLFGPYLATLPLLSVIAISWAFVGIPWILFVWFITRRVKKIEGQTEIIISRPSQDSHQNTRRWDMSIVVPLRRGANLSQNFSGAY
jgi:hypothetical protein